MMQAIYTQLLGGGVRCILVSMAFVFSSPALNAGVATGLLPLASTSTLAFGAEARVQPQDLPTRQQQLDRLHWQAAPLPNPAPAGEISPAFIAGGIVWQIGPQGTYLHRQAGGPNASTASTAFTRALTSSHVRAQTVVDDPSRQAVWFYGEALYRYDTTLDTLHRFSASGLGPDELRSMAASAQGLWFAGKGQAVHFDDARQTFQAFDLPGSSGQGQLLRATVLGETVWFADAQGQLVKLRHTSGISYVSTAHPNAGQAAQLQAAGGRLWMLLYRHNDYSLAFLTPESGAFTRVAGQVLALRQEAGQIVATGHSSRLTIDPVSLKTQTSPLSGAPAEAPAGAPANGSLLARAKIKFLGSSYTVKDPSEVVEHRPLDISRGWLAPQLAPPLVLLRPAGPKALVAAGNGLNALQK